MAYGLAALQPEDFITIHPANRPQWVIWLSYAPGTGLGEAGLYWNGKA